MSIGQALHDPVRPLGGDVEDPAAGFTLEVVVGLEIAVVAERAGSGRHLGDESFGDENLEIPVDGGEREGGHAGQERRVDLRGGRVASRRAQVGEEPLALARMMAARRVGDRGGGIHDLNSRSRQGEPSREFEKNSRFGRGCTGSAGLDPPAWPTYRARILDRPWHRNRSARSDRAPRCTGEDLTLAFAQAAPSDRRRAGEALARVAGALVIAAMAAIGVTYWLANRGFESTDDAFVDGTLAYLAPEIQGRVSEVLVVENQRVEAGAVLVRLDPEESEIRVARAEANLAAARNRMVSAEAAAASADAEGKAATVEKWRTGRELERAETLASRGAASDQQLDAARAAHDAALAQVNALALRAEAERGVLGNAAPVRQAEAELREARLSLARTELRAPFDAVIGRKNVEPGDIVKAGESLIALTRVERRWVEANFKETQLGRMRPGNPATVEIDAFDDRVFYGHVESFSPASGAKYALIPPEPAVGNFTKVVQRVPVRIVLDEVEDANGRRSLEQADSGPELAVGLSAFVTVDVR